MKMKTKTKTEMGDGDGRLDRRLAKTWDLADWETGCLVGWLVGCFDWQTI